MVYLGLGEILTHFRAACLNGNEVVVIITRFNQIRRLSSDSELQVASGQGSLRHIENPNHIIYVCPFELFVDVVLKHATLPTGTITQRGPMRISYNTSNLFFKCMFTNLILHLCQSHCLCRF